MATCALVTGGTGRACTLCKSTSNFWQGRIRLMQCHNENNGQHMPVLSKATLSTIPSTTQLILTSVAVRSYSVYPPTYIKPIYQEEKLRELEESGEKAKLAFTPIYPAHSDEISSVFYDPVVTKFINYIMEEGRKELARTIVEQTFATIKRIQLTKYNKTTDPKEREKIILNPWTIFHMAVENAGPVLETMSIKRGGGTYQVPVPVKDKRKSFLGMKWIIEASLDKDPKIPMFRKLAWEILDAANETGRVVKRKQDLHKVCEANRAYAHYRWG